VVVGSKSHDAIEAEWLADFKASTVRLPGRPSGTGWLTVMEMATEAGEQVDRMRRWIKSRPEGYWEVAYGMIAAAGDCRRAATFYRKNPNFSTA
jgi:hypothetical protein